MGKEAQIRIQNKSTHVVEITIDDVRNVQEDGLATLSGSLEPNAVLPPTGWGRIEGEPRLRISKDGYFHVVAKTDSGNQAVTRLSVDHDHWWSQGRVHGCQEEEGVAIAVDIDKSENDEEHIVVRIYDNIPSATWMNHLDSYISESPLCHVNIPGTHDSCTYEWNEDMGASSDSPLTTGIQEKLDVLGKVGDFITDGIFKVVFERICQCQDKTTMEQLQAGIRYLDLRVAYHAESQTFWSCHGVYCVKYETILGEIKQFLTEHPKEILLLDFNHFYDLGDEQHEQFAKLIVDTIGPDTIANRNSLQPASKVSEFWDAGARAVCIYHHDATAKASDGKLWHRGHLHSPWPNKNDTTELFEKLDGLVKGRNKNVFFVLQGILTPDGELIKEEILARRPGISIKSIAHKASTKVVDWTEEEWKDENHNVVIVDFFQDCSMVQSILNLNKGADIQ